MSGPEKPGFAADDTELGSRRSGVRPGDDRSEPDGIDEDTAPSRRRAVADDTELSARRGGAPVDDTVLSVRRAAATEDDTELSARRAVVPRDDTELSARRGGAPMDDTQLSARRVAAAGDDTALSRRRGGDPDATGPTVVSPRGPGVASAPARPLRQPNAPAANAIYRPRAPEPVRVERAPEPVREPQIVPDAIAVDRAGRRTRGRRVLVVVGAAVAVAVVAAVLLAIVLSSLP
ncbi:MAG: hypothetical protein J0J05_13715 [Microbacterium sp.]|uniref:hypothetical protein n=1 Tax=Microbacterium sp. TaxID=51671 RepID=UPI001AD1A830|nr:hypothetical protein [Microbacterium sp.]MBN9155033.1 hypothetical protein [Microbacterium sp.]